MVSHTSCLHFLAVLSAVCVYAFTLLFTSGIVSKLVGMRRNTTSTLYMFRIDATPAPWSFYLCPLIYLYQAVWLVYGVSTLCRSVVLPSGEKCSLHSAYPVTPTILYVVFSFSLACNVSWLLIWDREYLEIALVFVDLMIFTLYICLIISLRRLNERGAEMLEVGMPSEVWLIRLIVQNGLGMFASWGSVAAMYNFAVVLKYRTGAIDEVGTTVSMAIFTMAILVWWVLDNFIFDRLLRYILTPYLVVAFCLVSVLAGGAGKQLRGANFVMTITMLVLVVILTMLKCGIAIIRHKNTPLYQMKRTDSQEWDMNSMEIRNLLGEHI